MSEPHRRVCENRSGPDKQDPPARLFGNDDAPPSMNHPEGWRNKPRDHNSRHPAYANCSDGFDKLIHP